MPESLNLNICICTPQKKICFLFCFSLYSAEVGVFHVTSAVTVGPTSKVHAVERSIFWKGEFHFCKILTNLTSRDPCVYPL